MRLTDFKDALNSSKFRLVSTDIFDTVLLRDTTTEAQRLKISSIRAAHQLGIDPVALTRLRWDVQAGAYRSVAIERPNGDASLSEMCTTLAALLGLEGVTAEILHSVEVDVDIDHLRPNRQVVQVLTAAARQGVRVVAVSDTYYSTTDLKRMILALVGRSPLAAVYSSSDLGATKHAGGIFAQIAKLEQVDANEILHIGDSRHSDIDMAGRSGWQTLHVPRSLAYRASKRMGQLRSLPVQAERLR